MNFWIQPAGETAWQPLADQGALLMPGVYSLAVQSPQSHFTITAHIHRYDQAGIGRKELWHSERSMRTDAEGIGLILREMDLGPGWWDIRCTDADLIAELFGEGHQDRLSFQVLPMLATSPLPGPIATLALDPGQDPDQAGVEEPTPESLTPIEFSLMRTQLAGAPGEILMITGRTNASGELEVRAYCGQDEVIYERQQIQLRPGAQTTAFSLKLALPEEWPADLQGTIVLHTERASADPTVAFTVTRLSPEVTSQSSLAAWKPSVPAADLWRMQPPPEGEDDPAAVPESASQDGDERPAPEAMANPQSSTETSNPEDWEDIDWETVNWDQVKNQEATAALASPASPDLGSSESGGRDIEQPATDQSDADELACYDPADLYPATVGRTYYKLLQLSSVSAAAPSSTMVPESEPCPEDIGSSETLGPPETLEPAATELAEMGSPERLAPPEFEAPEFESREFGVREFESREFGAVAPPEFGLPTADLGLADLGLTESGQAQAPDQFGPSPLELDQGVQPAAPESPETYEAPDTSAETLAQFPQSEPLPASISAEQTLPSPDLMNPDPARPPFIGPERLGITTPPTLQLALPEPLQAGVQQAIAISLGQDPLALWLRLEVRDHYTGQVIDGPRWLLEWDQTETGDWQVQCQMVVPLGVPRVQIIVEGFRAESLRWPVMERPVPLAQLAVERSIHG